MVWQARFKRACALKLHAWRKECPQAPPKGSLLIDSHQARLRLERASNPDARLNSRIVYEAVRYIPFESSMRNGRETRQAVDIALKQLRKTVLSSISNTDKAALGEKQVDDGLAIIAQMYLEDVHGALRDVNLSRPRYRLRHAHAVYKVKGLGGFLSSEGTMTLHRKILLHQVGEAYCAEVESIFPAELLNSPMDQDFFYIDELFGWLESRMTIEELADHLFLSKSVVAEYKRCALYCWCGDESPDSEAPLAVDGQYLDEFLEGDKFDKLLDEVRLYQEIERGSKFHAERMIR